MKLFCNSCYEPVTLENMFISHDSCFYSLIQQNQELKVENDRLRELNQDIISTIKTNS